MFQRFFGAEKKKAPAPSLDDVGKRAEGRVTELDEKIGKMDAELAKYRDQLKKMKPGPSKKSVEQRALNLLKQKKMYEKQREQVQGQVFNIDQTKFAQASLKDSADMVSAMRSTHASIKEQFSEFSIDDVEDLHDDMAELMEDTEEMNEILGRSYGVPENIDEEDLMAELESLDSELASELESEEVPSYLVPASSVPAQRVPAERAAAPAISNSSSSAAGGSGGRGGGGGIVNPLDFPSAPRALPQQQMQQQQVAPAKVQLR